MTSENDINASCGYVQEEYLKHQCGGVISILNDHLDDFLARKERLTSHIQLMQEELEKIDGEISKAEYVLSIFKDEISIPESSRKSGALDASNGQFDEIFCGKADLQDIKDCGTQRQALYGSIPAGAGQPALLSATLDPTGVYPRGCGAAVISGAAA